MKVCTMCLYVVCRKYERANLKGSSSEIPLIYMTNVKVRRYFVKTSSYLFKRYKSNFLRILYLLFFKIFFFNFYLCF